MRVFIWKLKNSLSLFISNQSFLISCKLTSLLIRMTLCNDFSTALICVNQIMYNNKKAYLIWLNSWNNIQHHVKACLIRFTSAYLMTYLKILYIFICYRNFAWAENSWSMKLNFLSNYSATVKIYCHIFFILLRNIAWLRLLM